MLKVIFNDSYMIWLASDYLIEAKAVPFANLATFWFDFNLARYTGHCIQDIDACIHHSGRKECAGRTGLSILYKPQQEYMVLEVERVAGNRFHRIGAHTTTCMVIFHWSRSKRHYKVRDCEGVRDGSVYEGWVSMAFTSSLVPRPPSSFLQYGKARRA